ncbi:MAG: radical SAM protein, partial [Gammaproteobacteria bacterium]|nr:radical SAM protein [Gammaproteobacteria bacterium]
MNASNTPDQYHQTAEQRLRGKLLAAIDSDISAILGRAMDGVELTEDDAIALFQTTGKELDALVATADYVRYQANGNAASFVITRNINFTNVCYMGCKFCGFAKRKNDALAELLTVDEVANRAEQAWHKGATEVCIQGGLHPDIDGSHYRNIIKAIKSRVPDLHIHGFSPFEIWFGAQKSKLSIAAFIQ